MDYALLRLSPQCASANGLTCQTLKPSKDLLHWLEAMRNLCAFFPLVPERNTVEEPILLKRDEQNHVTSPSPSRFSLVPPVSLPQAPPLHHLPRIQTDLRLSYPASNHRSIRRS